MSVNYATTHNILLEARRKVAQPVWNYVTGASETETTMRRNRHALDCLAFRPRVMRDMTDIDTGVSFLGHRLRIPAMLAPIGSLQTIVPEGAVAVAQAAEKFGTLNFVSTVTQPSLEEIAASVDHPKIFQIYLRGDDDWVADLIARAKAAGYAALTLTVDSAFYGRRERQMLTNWIPPSVRAEGGGRAYQRAMTWDSMARMKELGGMPFILKGIQTREDAKIALEYGVDCIYVSNHGGRQMDYGQGTMDILPEVVEAVDGKVPVLVDGGFVRGTDIIKALALGASAVCLGRFQAWCLAAGGADGLVRGLELLELEMVNSMGLIGANSVADLTPDYITRAPAVTEAHELGAFTHLPEDHRL